MTSNIKVQRICQYCGKEFTARTTVTQFCSDDCAKRAYKARQRALKVETSDYITNIIRGKPFEELNAKMFLTIAESCKMLSVSRTTIWRAIKRNDLKAGRIGRRVIIKRSELDKLLN